MPEINLLSNYPKSKRPIDARAKNVTEEIRKISRKFDFDYFDGDRMYGYGGYNYNPKFWTQTVKDFYKHYNMRDNYRILDLGCGKGFMLYDFFVLNNKLDIYGIDISQYAIDNAKKEVKKFITKGNATNIPFEDNYFDLVISINTIHNLNLTNLKNALGEITRVSKKKSFVTVDAWRNEEEKDRILKWNLTALTYMHVDEWKILFDSVGYDGDYYWFIP